MFYQSIAGFLIVSSTIWIGNRLGYFNRIKDNFTKARLLTAVLNQVTKNGSDTVPVFSINNTGKSASIKYSRYGCEYILNVPYNRQKLSLMSKLKVFLVLESGEQVEITQQPGVPYTVSARDLGGKQIKVIQPEGTSLYSIDEVPMFCS